jgi:hypothetical protein
MNATSIGKRDPSAPRRRRTDPSRMRLSKAPLPVVWGVVGGAAGRVASWLLVAASATVYACGIIVIASVYTGFSVADGRPKIIAIETGVATAFVVLAATAITRPAWLLVAGLAAHGLKDFWQHRTRFVANTRWWPPFAPPRTGSLAAAITQESTSLEL